MYILISHGVIPLGQSNPIIINYPPLYCDPQTILSTSAHQPIFPIRCDSNSAPKTHPKKKPKPYPIQLKYHKNTKP